MTTKRDFLTLRDLSIDEHLAVDHLKTAMGFANLKYPREAPGCE